MTLVLDVLFIIAGFVLLMKGADYFVDGAASLASKMGIPTLIIGLTIVAMGTSAPEAAISISAAMRGSTGIAIGNIYGSNIMNVLLILGIASCIVPLKVGKTTIRYEIPFMILITALLAGLGYATGVIGKLAGVIFWGAFILYFVYLFFQSKRMDAPEEGDTKQLKGWQIAACIIGGMLAIVLGSDLTVDHAKSVATAIGISDRIIGLTVVAFGTSLPELITSVTAARKNQADIAIGNIVGSNIFNILFVLGTTGLIADITYSAAFVFDSIIAIATAALLLICVVRKEKLNRMGGIVMLLCYSAYFVYTLVGK